jgi:hypothetical protein
MLLDPTAAPDGPGSLRAYEKSCDQQENLEVLTLL